MWVIDSSSFVTVESPILLIVVIKCVGILKVLVLFSGLGFASIAFFSERKVEIVAVEAYPIALSCLVVCFVCLIRSLGFLYRCGVVEVHYF